MIPALRWATMRATLMCEGQSHKTVSTDHKPFVGFHVLCVLLLHFNCGLLRSRWLPMDLLCQGPEY